MTPCEYSHSICFFFFQAEDGIRDIGVTGVQTCALPILIDGAGHALRSPGKLVLLFGGSAVVTLSYICCLYLSTRAFGGNLSFRSEERRVGKEGRSRWSPYY